MNKALLNKILQKILVLFILPLTLCAQFALSAYEEYDSPFAISAYEEYDHPFNYDLHLTTIPGTGSEVMICLHGMGGDYRIGYYVKGCTEIDETLVSFNFPDYGITEGNYDPSLTTFGTIDELLPVLYVMKKCIIDDGYSEVNLYGFSAGGGAVINALAVLNTSDYDDELYDIGIDEEIKQVLLATIQRGWVILDTPLKSVAEISDYMGMTPELDIIGTRVRENGMEPIESMEKLAGLALNVIVHFQENDLVLSNRDDFLYFMRLDRINHLGTTCLVIGHDNGHSFPHPSLWKFYE